MAKKFHISRRFRYTFLDLTVKKYEINKSPKCAPFRMKCSKSRQFLGLRPRPCWGSLRRSPDPIVVRGFLPSAIAASHLRCFQFSQFFSISVPPIFPISVPQSYVQIYAYVYGPPYLFSCNSTTACNSTKAFSY